MSPTKRAAAERAAKVQRADELCEAIRAALRGLASERVVGHATTAHEEQLRTALHAALATTWRTFELQDAIFAAEDALR